MAGHDEAEACARCSVSEHINGRLVSGHFSDSLRIQVREGVVGVWQ